MYFVSLNLILEYKLYNFDKMLGGCMKKYINLILLLIWLIFIFVMSHFDADTSSSQSGSIVEVIANIFNIKNIEILSLIIRKLAHITEYFILGILTINCLKDYKIKKIYISSILFCIIYACSDEFHQLFISGRSGTIIDVLIDSIGIILGIFIYKLFKKLVLNGNN